MLDDELKHRIQEIRERVARRTFVQDITEPMTGRVDRQRVAAKFNNLEHAVDELAEVVEHISDDEQRKTA